MERTERVDRPKPVRDEIVLVAPNGATHETKYRPHDTVGKTLEHGVKEFNRSGDLDPSLEYMLVLNDTPLDNILTLEQAGVKPGHRLKIRSKRRPVDGIGGGYGTGNGDASGAL